MAKKSSSSLSYTLLALAIVIWTWQKKEQRSQETLNPQIQVTKESLRSEQNKFQNPTPESFIVSSDLSLTDSNQNTKFSITFRNVLPESPPTQTLTFTFNPEAKEISFAELLFFLKNLNSHLNLYQLDTYDCKHFAHTLYETAIAKNIKAKFVAIEYLQSAVGHAIVGFPTTDQDMVFVDFTPSQSNGVNTPSKRLIWLEEDKNYLDIPLDQLYMGFQNRFVDFNEYHEKHRELSNSAEALQNEADKLMRLSRLHEQELASFNRTIQNINDNRIHLSADEIQKIEKEKERINSQAIELNQMSSQINQEANELRQMQENIGLPTSREIVKSYQLFPEDKKANR